MPDRTRKPREQSRVAVGAQALIADAASEVGIDQVEGRRLLRSFFALPQVERDEFLRKIEVASLRWREPAPDQVRRDVGAG